MIRSLIRSGLCHSLSKQLLLLLHARPRRLNRPIRSSLSFASGRRIDFEFAISSLSFFRTSSSAIRCTFVLCQSHPFVSPFGRPSLTYTWFFCSATQLTLKRLSICSCFPPSPFAPVASFDRFVRSQRSNRHSFACHFDFGRLASRTLFVRSFRLICNASFFCIALLFACIRLAAHLPPSHPSAYHVTWSKRPPLVPLRLPLFGHDRAMLLYFHDHFRVQTIRPPNWITSLHRLVAQSRDCVLDRIRRFTVFASHFNFIRTIENGFDSLSEWSMCSKI